MSEDAARNCPCGSGAAYAACCGRLLAREEIAQTAEQLMRSRYTAYALRDERYLLDSWHVSTRPRHLSLLQHPVPRWIGLKVLRTEAGGVNDERGVVEFVARYKVGGKAERLHESSRFVKENGAWYYVDGEIQ